MAKGSDLAAKVENALPQKLLRSAKHNFIIDDGGTPLLVPREGLLDRTSIPMRNIRAIPGTRWSSKRGTLRLPDNADVVLRVYREMDGWNEKPFFSKSVSRWLREEIAQTKAVRKAKSTDFLDVPVLREHYPDIWKAIQSRPFQTYGAAFLAAHGGGLIADDPGLGKTLQTIAGIIAADTSGPILILAPKTAAIVTWPTEIDRWAGEDVTVATGSMTVAKRRKMISEFIDRSNREGGRHWLICNSEMVRGKYKGPNFMPNVPELFEKARPWSAIVVDESHKVLTAKSAKKSSFSQVRAGMANLPLKKGGMRIAISGTPQKGSNHRLWGTLNWLRPTVYTSYWKWVEKWFHVEAQYFGGVSIGEIKDVKGLSQELAPLMVRRTKAEVLPELPPKEYRYITIPMLPKQERMYQQIIKSAMAEVDSGALVAVGVLATMVRLKQLANSCCDVEGDPEGDGVIVKPTGPSNKINWILEWLEDRRDHDGKVIIATQFSSFAKLIAETLEKEGWESHLLTGATPPGQRKAMQKEFQAPGGPRVFILNTIAGGVSLTLDAADDVIITDQTWSPDDQQQVEDRAHRLSRPDHKVGIWYLMSKDSIEEQIHRAGLDKVDSSALLLDKSRGVDTARKILEIS